MEKVFYLLKWFTIKSQKWKVYWYDKKIKLIQWQLPSCQNRCDDTEHQLFCSNVLWSAIKPPDVELKPKLGQTWQVANLQYLSFQLNLKSLTTVNIFFCREKQTKKRTFHYKFSPINRACGSHVSHFFTEHSSRHTLIDWCCKHVLLLMPVGYLLALFNWTFHENITVTYDLD